MIDAEEFDCSLLLTAELDEFSVDVDREEEMELKKDAAVVD